MKHAGRFELLSRSLAIGQDPIAAEHLLSTLRFLARDFMLSHKHELLTCSMRIDCKR